MIYLLKVLINTKRVYGPLELEIGYLAWAVRKIRTILKSAEKPVVILTDHHAIKGIIKKTTLDTMLINQANRCFIAVSIYLAEYDLKIYHIPGRLNIVPNTLLRLPINTNARN